MKIVVYYPPTYDGELDINVEESKRYFKYTFVHAKKGDAWLTLVEAARGILSQHDRRKEKQRRNG